MLTPAESKAQRLYALALVFYFVSFIGWCGETLLFLVRFGRLRDRGFLTLPFCTIYGSCLTGMYLFAGTPQNGRLAPLFAKAEGLRGAARPAAKCGLYALYFLCAALLPTLAELAFGGLFSAFGVRLWDYGYKKVHLYGLISPDQSLLWGALITLAMRFAWEPLHAAMRLPPRVRKTAAIALTALTSADFLFCAAFLLITGRRPTLF
ncbi:MAG TPA: putative ABC transporter permease [Candidatus Borkfalkia avicola]|uniref:ABC transporter permease n=1 Tax=Candidatus Borkfalkia avicola TaxID=2838503 RepID=A0A9D2IJ82_9FIRM|nr:putative ABC transporter permease [Candidatus Borkfalkia avicola]